MSALPLLFLADELDGLNAIYQQPRRQQRRHHHHLLQPAEVLALSAPFLQHIRQLSRQDGSGDAAIDSLAKIGKEGFQASLDVSHFKPNELNVKVVDNFIVVEGKHEERADEHGYISRQFSRRYRLPDGYDPAKVASTLSSDGVLTVSVPKPAALENKSNERVVNIQQVGPAHLNVKENPKETVESGKQNDAA